MQVATDAEREIITITDHEFNLKWILQSKNPLQPIANLKLNQLLRLKDPPGRLPSYDEFVTLIDGLHFGEQSLQFLLNEGDLFLLADKPEERLHLLASFGRPVQNDACRVVDRDRKLSSTAITISAFVTGVSVHRNYGNHISVRQLWIVR